MSEQTPQTTTPERTAEESITLLRRHLQHEITTQVSDLDRALTEVIERAQAARDAIAAGNRVPGMYSVLSDAPREVEQRAARLEVHLMTARAVLTDAEIVAAYKVDRW